MGFPSQEHINSTVLEWIRTIVLSRGNYVLLFADLFFFKYLFFHLVFHCTDLPRSKPLLQNIERPIFGFALAGNIIWQSEYPEHRDYPNKPPYQVHSPIINK